VSGSRPSEVIGIKGQARIGPRYRRVKARARVHEHWDGSLARFHGLRKIASYTADGKLDEEQVEKKLRRYQNRSRAICFVLRKVWPVPPLKGPLVPILGRAAIFA
jgi:hypothetical protein